MVVFMEELSINYMFLSIAMIGGGRNTTEISATKTVGFKIPRLNFRCLKCFHNVKFLRKINPRHSIQKDAHMAMPLGIGVVLLSQRCGGSWWFYVYPVYSYLFHMNV